LYNYHQEQVSGQVDTATGAIRAREKGMQESGIGP
jgi:hypothetical protein